MAKGSWPSLENIAFAVSWHEVSYCSVLLKTGSPYKNIKESFATLCVLGSITNSCITLDSPEQWCRMGGKRRVAAAVWCDLHKLHSVFVPACNPDPKVSTPATSGRTAIFFKGSMLVGVIKTSRISSRSCTLRLDPLV